MPELYFVWEFFFNQVHTLCGVVTYVDAMLCGVYVSQGDNSQVSGFGEDINVGGFLETMP